MGVQLWGVQLDRSFTEQEEAELLRHLPTDRADRLLRLRDPQKRQEPLAAYGLLRLALFQTCGLTELPSISYGENGKPDLAESPALHFNLSHTNGAVLVGLSEAPVGVDIERRRPVSRWVKERLAAEKRTEEQYFRDWVCYEAWVKRSGEGVRTHHAQPDPSLVEEVELFPGFFSAVSGSGAACIRYRGTVDSLLTALKQI